MNSPRVEDAGIDVVLHRCRVCGSVFERVLSGVSETFRLTIAQGFAKDVVTHFPVVHDCQGDYDGLMGYSDIVGFRKPEEAEVADD